MTDIVIPALGIAMEEALLTQWFRQPGEAVAVEDPVAEIETDKATMDLTSPVAGVLGPRLFEAGATVPVGAAVTRVYADSDAARAAAEAPAPATAATGLEADAPAGPSPVESSGRAEPRRLSPRARRALREQNTAGEQGERFRSLIADKVAQSWREIPHFAVTREVDAEAVLSLLTELREHGFEVAPTLTDPLLAALAQAVRAVDGTSSVDIGLAVATEQGVVIPVLRNVLALPPAALSRSRAEAVERARSRRLTAEDLAARPSTTLSNLGSRGVDHFTGIIASGQTSLLTVGRAVPRAVAIGGADVGVRTTFYATVNADHRTIDGAGAAELLEAFAAAVEAPGRLFEGVA
jgi:pyruvate/2-oxoglutarate dehydrogenase complex dihydrolipoamide acyltransferase (E2) component